MAVGTADYAIKNLNEKTNAEIEGFLKYTVLRERELGISQEPEATETKSEEK